MFTDKETILQCKEDDFMQIQNQEEEDDDEVMPELIQEVEKGEEENIKNKKQDNYFLYNLYKKEGVQIGKKKSK